MKGPNIRKEEEGRELEWMVKFMDKKRKKKSITNWWIQMLWLTSGRRELKLVK
jgi:hypothetical protein